MKELERETIPMLMNPVRALILTENRRAMPVHLVDLHRWISFVSTVFEVRKIDVFSVSPQEALLQNLLAYAREFQVRISLRTACATPPFPLASLKEEGLMDLLLCPAPEKQDALFAWMAAGAEAELPLRLQFSPDFLAQVDREALAARCVESGVRVVSIIFKDPFSPDSEKALLAEKALVAFVEKLNEAVIDVRVWGAPESMDLQAIAALVADQGAFVRDFQQYHQEAYALALKIFHYPPRITRAVLLLLLSRYATFNSAVDRWLLAAVRLAGNPLEGLYQFQNRLRRLFWNRLPIRRATQNASTPLSVETPLEDRRYLDAVDAYRLQERAYAQRLQQEAYQWEEEGTPSRSFGKGSWGFENAHNEFMIGANRVFAGQGGEKRSSILDWFELPVLLSFTCGAGLAESVGFAIGRPIRVMCPMTQTRHTISLYVNDTGRYVLLRDGQVVEPLQVAGRTCVPDRLPDRFSVQLVAWEISESLSISPVRVWEEAMKEATPAAPIKHSIVIFCTRFSRRLAVALQSIAHQQDIDLACVEVLIGYVPGIDATEDVLESMQLAHPELRIVHVTFPKSKVFAKGFVLNQALEMARGECIMLLDADVAIGPKMLSRLEAASAEHSFICPRGRAMLSPETTAKLLLGEVKPWENYEALMKAVEDFRDDTEAKGVPIGYCQYFHRSCLEQVRYQEYEHFQGADFEFGEAMRKHFGMEHRLDYPVFHLDHAGSQWYGTIRQF